MGIKRGLLAGFFVLCAVMLAVSPVLASEEGNPAKALITPHIGTIFWTLVTFGIMIVILARFAWKPMLGALAAREKSIQDSIDQAARDREEAQTLLKQHRDLTAEAHRERAAALERGRQDAEKLKGEILEEARKQREQLLAQTEAQVQAGLRQAQAELRTAAVDMAIQAAEKLLVKNLDDASQRRLVEEYLTDLDDSDKSDKSDKPGHSGTLPS